MTVSVRWSAFLSEDEDLETPFADNHEILLSGDWADCAGNGESAVGDICELYFGESEWNELWGTEATCADVVVEVHGPASIAGRYAVELRRVIQASARKLSAAVVG
jgi:hypothetical protein